MGPTATVAAGYGLDRYLHAVNHVAARQVYLHANPLLEKPLPPRHVRERLPANCPRLAFIYARVNRLNRRTDASVLPLLLQGPDHGAAPDFPNPYLGGRLADAYPELPLARPGLERFAEKFSWPGEFANHPDPKVPGVTREDGELG